MGHSLGERIYRSRQVSGEGVRERNDRIAGELHSADTKRHERSLKQLSKTLKAYRR